MPIRTEVYRTIEAAREVWLAFEEQGDLYVFQTIEWLENWHRHVGRKAGVEPCLIAVYDDDHPLYFFPFGIARMGPASALVWLGGELCDYGAPIVVSEESPADGTMGDPRGRENDPAKALAFQGVWAEVRRQIPPVDFVWLVRIPERVGNRPNPMCGLRREPYHSSAHVARLTGTWDAFYESHAGPKTRSTDRRKLRRLSALGDLTYTVTDGSDDAAARRITRAMIEQKEKRYREIQARNLFVDEAYGDFFSDCASSLMRRRWLSLSEMSLDGRIITTHWGMVFKDRFYYFMPSFARGSWMRFSPGRLLLFRLFEWCFQHEVKILDFTVGDEAYKAGWCDEELRLYQHFTALTWKGRLFGVFYAVYSRVGRSTRLLGLARRSRGIFRSVRYRMS